MSLVSNNNYNVKSWFAQGRSSLKVHPCGDRCRGHSSYSAVRAPGTTAVIQSYMLTDAWQCHWLSGTYVGDTELRSYLPAEVSVVHVTHKQRLSGESVWLDVHICSRHLGKNKNKLCYIDEVSVSTASVSTHEKISTQGNRWSILTRSRVQEIPVYL